MLTKEYFSLVGNLSRKRTKYDEKQGDVENDGSDVQNQNRHCGGVLRAVPDDGLTLRAAVRLGALMCLDWISGDRIAWNTYASRIAWYKADFSLKESVLKYEQLGQSQYFPTKIDDPNAAVAFSTNNNVAHPNGAAYFRVSEIGNGENLIVTLDEEIT